MEPGPQFATWTKLTCPACGCGQFSRLYGLSTRAQGGTVETQEGWECRACRTLVDVHTMLQHATLDQLRRQVAEQQAQIDALSPVPVPMSSAPSGSNSGT